MNVLLVIRSLGVGGSERQAVRLAAGLAARGHGVSFVQLMDGSVWDDELDAAGVPTHCLGLRHRADLTRVGRLVPLLRRLRPDVMHGFHVESNLLCLAAARLVGRPAVVWGYRTSSHALLAEDTGARALERAHRLLARRADAAIASSEAGAASARADCAPVHLIRNGVDTGRFQHDAEAGARVRRELGVGPDELLIGSVARLVPAKRIELFVEAAAHLARDRPEARFVCVGTGDAAYRDSLVELAARRGLDGSLIWAGVRKDMPAVYSALDVCTLVSIAEGTSNAVAEALACGVPCVVSDVGDLAYLVGDPQLVVPQDPALVAAGWKHALALGEETRAAWRRRIERECGLDRMVDETERLLLRVVQERRRGASG